MSSVIQSRVQTGNAITVVVVTLVRAGGRIPAPSQTPLPLFSTTKRDSIRARLLPI